MGLIIGFIDFWILLFIACVVGSVAFAIMRGILSSDKRVYGKSSTNESPTNKVTEDFYNRPLVGKYVENFTQEDGTVTQKFNVEQFRLENFPNGRYEPKKEEPTL